MFCLAVVLLLNVKVVLGSELRVVVFDVGMGQSILLEKNGHGILIDAGPVDRAGLVLKRLQAYGLGDLDFILLTHLHPDHAGGYAQIRRKFPKTPVLDNCHAPENADSLNSPLFSVTRALSDAAHLHDCIAAGDSLNWQGQQLQILWPPSPTGSNLNEMSLVLLLTTEDNRHVLVMGDAGIRVETRLSPALHTALQGTRLDLYVAGHHGAQDSTLPEFLQFLRPLISVVSVGRSNPFGYPSDTALKVLQQFSSKVLRTDRDGELCFRLSTEGPVPCMPPPEAP